MLLRGEFTLIKRTKNKNDKLFIYFSQMDAHNNSKLNPSSDVVTETKKLLRVIGLRAIVNKYDTES